MKQYNDISFYKDIDDDSSFTKICLMAWPSFSEAGILSILSTNSNEKYKIIRIDPNIKKIYLGSFSNTDVILIDNESIKELEVSISDIKRYLPKTKVIIFGDNIKNDIYHLLCQGVHGFINNSMNAKNLLSAIDCVQKNGLWIDRTLADTYIENNRKYISEQWDERCIDNIVRLKQKLTVKEIDVLKKVLKGISIRQISKDLAVSDQTVKLHLSKLFKKFEVKDRYELIIAAYDHILPASNIESLF